MEITYQDRVLRLTLDRVDKRNALNESVCRGLVDAFDNAEKDPLVGAILLDAKGPVFCAGMDFDESTTENAEQRTAIHAALFSAGFRLKKPIIAAIQGACWGGGVGLAASAHIAIAAENAQFVLSEIKVGMWPFAIWKALENAMGERRTLGLALMAQSFSALEAERWGLVHQVVAAEELASIAWQIAAQVAQASPEIIERGFALAHGSRNKTYQETLELALWLRARSLASADFQEGVAAWREKRTPRWPSLASATQKNPAGS